MSTQQTFTGNVNVTSNNEGLFYGVFVKWDTAPTTKGNLIITLTFDDSEYDTVIGTVSVQGSNTSAVYQPTSPFPVGNGSNIKVEYTNSGAQKASITILVATSWVAVSNK